MEQRRGDWFLTYTGRRFWILDPRPEDICIEDIAHHLALQTRYKGSCQRFYSVAQHSVLARELAKRGSQFGCLMHDAPEAYTGDWIRPIKYLPQVYAVLKPIEDRIWKVVCGVYGLDVEWDSTDNPEVKEVDNRLLMTERRGRAPANGNWKGFPNSLYCGGDHSAGVFTGDRDVEAFKCHHLPRPTNNEAFDEMGILRHELALNSWKDKAVSCLKEAGIWKVAKQIDTLCVVCLAVVATMMGPTHCKK